MEIADKIEKIKSVLRGYNCSYVVIDSDQEVDNIYNLLFNNIFFHPKSDIECFYCGWYESVVKKDNENAKKYYMMAIEKGNDSAMNNLAFLYEDVEKDYENAKKYYLMAIEKGNAMTMNNLAVLYEENEKDFENAKKYYLMAIEKGNAIAMNNLGLYYRQVEKDYENAKKYFIMAIQKGNANAMNNLAVLYEKNEKDFENAKKYYMMGIEKGDVDAISNLALFYSTIEKNYKQELKYSLMYLRKNLHLQRKFFYYYILAKTGLWPKKNLLDDEVRVIFYELLCFASKGCLPKGVMLKIAGSLFL
jgi:TPR repeat protein